MWKHFIIIASEVILLVLIGLLTNIASSTFLYGWIIWILIVAVLLVLIPTTWFRVQLDSEKAGFGVKYAIPEKIEFSITKEDILQTTKLLLISLFNGMLFGAVIAYISILFAKNVEMPYSIPFHQEALDGIEGWWLLPSVMASEHEVIGIAIIAFGSLFVLKRLSKTSGIIFCIISSLTFSFIHLQLIPQYYFLITFICNLFFALLGLAIGWILYPIIVTLFEFWQKILKNDS